MKTLRFRIWIIITILAILVLTLLPSVNGQNTTINIGSRLELFVDNYLIDRLSGGTELMLHHPAPQEIVITHDAPWEGSGSGYHTIFRDTDKFRMYYKAEQYTMTEGKLNEPHELFIAYAESEDGILWKKPELGLVEFEGSMKNNIVLKGSGSHGFTLFKDTNPSCTPDAVYKALGMGEKGGLYAFKSSDGIHWSSMLDRPVITKGAFDSQNLAFWDSLRGEYRAYVRDFRENRRDIRTATSKDFINWSDPVWLAYPDAPNEQLYTNQIKPYYRAPHIFIGFPSRYVERIWDDQIKSLPEFEHRKLRASASKRYGSAVTDALFMTSRDGLTFKRWGEAFIRPGLRYKDNWVYGDNYVAYHLIETKSNVPGAPNELSMYATESYWTGNSSVLRRFTLRIDGFVSAHATLKGGELLTKPVIFDGNTLVINFSTSAAGSISIEIQDETGEPIEGFTLNDSFEIFGDDLEREVEWKSGKSVKDLSGKPVRLRFVMKDADLFSIRFKK